MSEIRDYSNNPDPQTADRWPEGMAMSAVNDTGRDDEGIIGRWEKDVNGSLVSTGTSTAYAITPNRDLVTGQATPIYDGLELAFLPHVDCGASPTLNVQSTGAIAIKGQFNRALKAGDLKQNVPVKVIYNSTLSAFIAYGLRSTESFERVHVFDFIPESEWENILNGTSTYEANTDIRNACQEAITKGLPLVFPGPGSKIRYGDTSVTIMDAGQSGLTIYGNGCTQEKSGSSTVWITEDLVGDGTPQIALTTDALAGENVITVPQALIDITSVGDIVMLRSSLEAYDPGGADPTYAREGRRVVEITGTQIKLCSTLEFDFTVADGATIEQFSQYMCRNLTIHDIFSVNVNGSTARFLRVDNADGFKLYNFTGRGGGNLQLVDCFDFVLEDILCDRPGEGVEAGNGYGLNVAGSCRYGEIRNLSGSDTRHLFTTLSRIIAGTAYGGPSQWTVDGGTSRASDNTHIHDYDTHKEGNYGHIHNVVALRDGGSSGIKMRANNMTISNSRTRGGNRGLETTDQARNARWIDCETESCDTVGLSGGGAAGYPASYIRCRVYNPGQRGVNSTNDGTYYEDIYIENYANNGIRDQSTNGIHVNGARIVNGPARIADPVTGMTKSNGIYHGIDLIGFDKFDQTNSGVNGGMFTGCKWNGVAMENVVFDYDDTSYTARAIYQSALHTNRGATATQVVTLPLSRTGMKFPFQRVASFAIQVKPQSGETIDDQLAGTYLELSTDGAYGWFECLEDGSWVSRQITGTFTPE